MSILLQLPTGSLSKDTLLKGYKYRLYPNHEQVQYLAKAFGCARFVWNQTLDHIQKSVKDLENPYPMLRSLSNFNEINRHLNKLKAEHAWLYDVSAVLLQQKLNDLSAAYSNHLSRQRAGRKPGLPHFKRRVGHQSIRLTTNAFKLEGYVLSIAKVKTPVKVRWSRDLPNHPRSITLTRTPLGEYYVTFLCECAPKVSTGTGVVGIDAGISNLYAISDGTIIENPRHFVSAQRHLAIFQRRLAKKVKGSKNRQKALFKVNQQYNKIKNQRHDAVHKLTSKLIRENQSVCIEDLNIFGMVKNHKLAKHILDAGWGMMRQQLVYKAIHSQHTKILLADPFYPSTQLCSTCRRKPSAKIALGTAEWVCEYCQTRHHRDLNAAVNLEHLAHHTRETLPPEQYAAASVILVPGGVYLEIS